MAGVISRSAYLHGNVPEVDEGLTDTVCVIGIVKVKIAGPVQNGERIYASIDRPGIGIPETQFSLRSAGKCSAILLGQSLEAVHSPSLQVVKCVKCFVSIVLGIQSGQVFSALEDVRLYTRNKIAESIKREKKKFYRGLICKASIILILLSLVTAVLYEVFVPGSWFRYLLCRRGCIAHHNMWFAFSTDDHQTAKVHGIEFEWLVLKRRMDLPFNKYPNATGMHYYLNLERCAYGGIVPVKSHLDHTPQVRGAEVFVVDPSCSRVFFEQNAKWHIYGTAVDFKCEPPYK
ncbi:hypothetical protein QZH41_010488 [Actinostola sp. cb2023]|nr:hypothetical protein QZH41_010488 [Actinostola sp. cb2023]